MPLFASYYGLNRTQALNLKHWEFEQYRKFFYQQKARDTLSNYQSVGMAFGGSKEDTREYLEDLRNRAGYCVAKKSYNSKDVVKIVKESINEQERSFGIFDNLMGISPIEQYEALKTESFVGYGDQQLTELEN